MRLLLKLLFGAIFAAMIAVTVRAGLAMNLWDAWADYAANPWAVATLYDAYFGFVTFYAWVFYKERSLAARLIWFLLIMGLGNIATSLYVLTQLFRMQPGDGAAALLLRAPAR